MSYKEKRTTMAAAGGATAVAGGATAVAGGATAESTAIAVSGGKPSSRKGKGSLVWVSASNGEVPSHAVDAGKDDDGRVYVARAKESGYLLPGRLVPSQGCTFVALGNEKSHKSYEVLTNPKDCRLKWVSVKTGEVPPEAVVGGSQWGETLYIGRHMMDGQTAVGKVHQRTEKGIWLGWNGKEKVYKDYDLLICED